MNKKTWGPIIWKFLHVLTFKIKEESFKSQRQNIINILRLVFWNLPCPICTTHAIKLFKSSNLKLIKDKSSLIDFMFSFHNAVNRRLRKPLCKRESLNRKYFPMTIHSCCFDLSRVYHSRHTNNLRFNIMNSDQSNIGNQIIRFVYDNREHYDLK